MKNERTYEDLRRELDALAAGIDGKEAASANTLKTEAYCAAFWEGMHTGLPLNALKEGSDGAGGYLVPDTYEETLVEALNEKNVLRQIGRTIQTTRKLDIPVAYGGGDAVWAREGEPFAFTDVEFGKVTIDAHKLATSILVSDEMLEDGGIDLEAYLRKTFAERIGDAEERVFIRGTGGGMPLGLIQQAPVGATSRAEGKIDMDDMFSLMHSVKRPYRKNAVWVMSEDAYRLLRQIKASNGQNVWVDDMKEGEPKTLFGYPIYICKYLDKVAPGSIPVMFGDFSFFWIGDRGKRVFKRLVERFADRGQVAFIASERVDAKLVIPEAVKLMKISGESAETEE